MPVILDKSDDDSIESAVDAQASHCTESSFSLAAPSGSAASTLASVVASVSPCPPKEVAAAQNRHALGFELDDDKMDTDDDEADMVPSYLFDAVVNGAT